MTRTSFAPLRSLAIACALTGLALAFPVSGHAAQTFGSLLKNSPAPGPDPCVDTAPGPCTLVGYINPNDPGDPVTSPAPANGVIVRFRIRSLGAEAVTLRLATVTKQGDTILAQATRTGPTVTTQGTGEIEEFPARLQVVNGEHLALDAPSTRMVYNQGGNEYTPLYAPPLVEGQGPRGQEGSPPVSCWSRRRWSRTPTATASVTRRRTGARLSARRRDHATTLGRGSVESPWRPARSGIAFPRLRRSPFECRGLARDAGYAASAGARRAATATGHAAFAMSRYAAASPTPERPVPTHGPCPRVSVAGGSGRAAIGC